MTRPLSQAQVTPTPAPPADTSALSNVGPLSKLRRYLAARKLQAIVERNRNAPATVEYRRRRKAAITGLLRKQVTP